MGIIDRVKNFPITVSASSAATGAVLVFLITSATEVEKKETAILGHLNEISHQVTTTAEAQGRFEGRMLEISQRTAALERQANSISSQLDRMARTQTELQREQIRIDSEMLQFKTSIPVMSRQYVAANNLTETVQEIVKMKQEGASGVWIGRGYPYASTQVLRMRLNRPVTAEERDQAATLIQVNSIYEDEQ